MKTSVITSKVAQDHLDEVKIRHADMVKGMQEQSMRMQQINMQKNSENQIKKQQEFERLTADRDFEQKDRELEIMQMAAQT